MKSTFKVLLYLKKGSEKKNGEVMIMARITIDGKLCQFSTKQSILSENWNIVAGKAKAGKSSRDVGVYSCRYRFAHVPNLLPHPSRPFPLLLSAAPQRPPCAGRSSGGLSLPLPCRPACLQVPRGSLSVMVALGISL